MLQEWQRQRATAERMVKKYGVPALLRRDNLADRNCFVAVTDFSPQERAARMINPTDMVGLLISFDVSPPPNQEHDVVVLLDPETLAEKQTVKIVAPPGKLESQGHGIYWELQLRK